MGIAAKAAEAEAKAKALARAAAERDLDAINKIVSRAKPLETTADVAKALKDVARLQKEKQKRGSDLQGTLRSLAQVRERFFRELASTHSKFRAFAKARDALTLAMRSSLSRAEREGRTGDNVKRDFKKKIAKLEAEASRVAGQRVRADDFETLVTRSRKLTSEEERFVQDAKTDAEAIRKELLRFRRANNAAIARVRGALDAMEKFSGVSGARIGEIDVTARVKTAAGTALNKLRNFLQQLQTEQADLAVGVNQAEAIIEAARPGMTLEAAETFAARLSNLSLLGAAIGILAGAAASPVVGVLLALGLISKLFNRLFSEASIARRIINS